MVWSLADMSCVIVDGIVWRTHVCCAMQARLADAYDQLRSQAQLLEQRGHDANVAEAEAAAAKRRLQEALRLTQGHSASSYERSNGADRSGAPPRPQDVPDWWSHITREDVDKVWKQCGWTQHVDASTQRSYYHHNETGQTTWTQPKPLEAKVLGLCKCRCVGGRCGIHNMS